MTYDRTGDLAHDSLIDAIEDDLDEWEGIEWFCNHDVPNGCSSCARARSEQEMLDNMSDEERQEYLYDGGDFESFFAPGGPAWQRGL